MTDAERLKYYARLLVWLRAAFINISDGIEDEGDRAYFGSTNDADLFREIVRKLDDVKWSLVMREVSP